MLLRPARASVPSFAAFSAACLLLTALIAACGGKVTSRPAADGAAADLVLVNGKIVTMDEAMPEVSALAARDGEIVAVGDDKAVRAHVGEATRVIDLEGRLAVPGFIESHGHFLGIGDSRIQLDLRSARGWKEIVDMVAEAAAEAEPGTWIRGRGWHQEKWDSVPEPSVEGFPLHASLSAVSPANPVMLTHASGHALFANAKAMALAEINARTESPPGGEILHGPSGKPTGLFRETAASLIHGARSADGSVPAEEVRRMIALASEECLSKGVTSLQDAGSPLEDVATLELAAQDGLFGMRLWMMIRDSNERLATHLGEYKAKRVEEMFKVGGIKLSIDGALGARGAWLLKPYSDSPGSTGLNLVPIEAAQQTAELAIEHGLQLCIHAIGDRANREVLDLYADAFAAHPEKSDLRWRVEHAQHLHPDEIPRFSELGVIASMQGVHCTSDGPWVPDRLGDERSEQGAYVWRKLLDSGAVVINGTDAPVEDVSPIASYYSSVSRRLPDGSRFYPDQVMSRIEALKSYTLDAAYGVFEEGIKGSLEVGKLADVVVLDQDILTIPEDDIPKTQVLYTIVGGKVAWER